MIKFLKKP